MVASGHRILLLWNNNDDDNSNNGNGIKQKKIKANGFLGEVGFIKHIKTNFRPFKKR